MKKLLLGLCLCAAAIGIPLAVFVTVVRSLSEDNPSFEAPGELEVTVEEPGRYYVWNAYKTVHEGRSYSRSKALPDGVTFRLVSSETGEVVPFQTDLSISTSTGEQEMSSVGYFEIEEAGRYRLMIEGVEEPRIFSFGPSIFSDFFAFFGKMLLGFLLIFGLLISGILLVIFGIIELDRGRRKQSPPPLSGRQ